MQDTSWRRYVRKLQCANRSSTKVSLSHFLFLLAINWVMRETTKGERHGIQWTIFDQLDDLDFADDLALLSHDHEQMQSKTTALQTTASKISIRINTEKTKVMWINTSRTERFSKFTRGSSVASYLHEKQTSRIQSFYLYFIKIVPFSWFWLRNIRFLIQNTRSLFYGRHYSSLHRLMSLHGKLNVKFFLMFIVAEKH